MRFSSYQKLIITAVLALLLALTSAWIFWRLSAGARSGVAMLRETEVRIGEFEEKRKAARLFEALLEERKEDFERISRFSPNRERPVELIEELEQLAKDTQNSISIDVDEGRSNIGQNLVFRLTVEGSETSSRNYLKLLLLLPYEIKVEDLVFQQITTAQKSVLFLPSHRLSAVISVKTF